MAAKKTAKRTKIKYPEKSAARSTRKRPATKKAAARKRAAAPAKRRAPLVRAHRASPRGGRACEKCGHPHTKREHGSHAEGARQESSYRTWPSRAREAAREAPPPRRRRR